MEGSSGLSIRQWCYFACIGAGVFVWLFAAAQLWAAKRGKLFGFRFGLVVLREIHEASPAKLGAVLPSSKPTTHRLSDGSLGFLGDPMYTAVLRPYGNSIEVLVRMPIGALVFILLWLLAFWIFHGASNSLPNCTIQGEKIDPLSASCQLLSNSPPFLVALALAAYWGGIRWRGKVKTEKLLASLSPSDGPTS